GGGAGLARGFAPPDGLTGTLPAGILSDAPGVTLAAKQAPVAQLDRASDYGSEGQGFESSRAHQREGQDGLPALCLRPLFPPCAAPTVGRPGATRPAGASRGPGRPCCP